MPAPHLQAPRWRAPYRIETDRLSLRAPDPGQLDQVHDVISKNRAHLVASMPWAQGEPLSRGARLELLTQMRGKFDLGLDCPFAIFERASDQYVGGTGLHPRIGPEALEIGYWISADWQGKGLIAETVAALVVVAFEVMQARRVEIRCSPQNSRSRAVPERLGFHLDGVLREGGLSGTGALEDKMVWSVLASEYVEHSLAAIPKPSVFDAAGQAIYPVGSK